MNIRTEMHRCPWGAEWYASDEDDRDEPVVVGIGATEAEAVADLKAQMALDEVLCPECGSGPGEPHSIHCSLEHGP